MLLKSTFESKYPVNHNFGPQIFTLYPILANKNTICAFYSLSMASMRKLDDAKCFQNPL
jgi:hypothetical protein